MSDKRHFTDEEKTELICNPYTARVSDCKVTFTLAFKQFVMDHIDLPGMTARKVFQMAGYRDELFSSYVRRYTVIAIRNEAASEAGLQEPSEVKPRPVKKKSKDAEVKELQERVTILEQQVQFLKKSRLLKKQDRSSSPDNMS